MSVFPDELYPVPRSWAEQAYPKLIHFNKLPKGGHFAAWEQPKLFSEEASRGLQIITVGHGNALQHNLIAARARPVSTLRRRVQNGRALLPIALTKWRANKVRNAKRREEHGKSDV